jgi:hypothetical protein
LIVAKSRGAKAAIGVQACPRVLVDRKKMLFVSGRRPIGHARYSGKGR